MKKREKRLLLALARGRACIAAGNVPPPCRRSGAELLSWLEARYRLLPLTSKKALSVARENVLFNPPLREKNCRRGKRRAPSPSPCRAAGRRGWPAMVFCRPRFRLLLCRKRPGTARPPHRLSGLDAADAKNPWMVSEYLRCKALYGEDGNGDTPRP